MRELSNAEAIRRRVAGWRAAEVREQQHRREQPVLDAETALLAAIELSNLASGIDTQDAVRSREIEDARRAWAKLRAHFTCLPSVPAR